MPRLTLDSVVLRLVSLVAGMLQNCSNCSSNSSSNRQPTTSGKSVTSVKTVVVMLVGQPGCGKTFTRRHMVAQLGAAGVSTVVVSQDDLGGRTTSAKSALKAALLGPAGIVLAKADADLSKLRTAIKTAPEASRSAIESKITDTQKKVERLQQEFESRTPSVVIVDRCNADEKQRSWVREASLQARAQLVAVMLNVPLALAAERAALRHGHPTLKHAALAFSVSLKHAEAVFKHPPRAPEDVDVVMSLGTESTACDDVGAGPWLLGASSCEGGGKDEGGGEGGCKDEAATSICMGAVQLVYAGWFLEDVKAIQDVLAFVTPPGQLRMARPHITVAYGSETRDHLGQVGKLARFKVRLLCCKLVKTCV